MTVLWNLQFYKRLVKRKQAIAVSRICNTRINPVSTWYLFNNTWWCPLSNAKRMPVQQGRMTLWAYVFQEQNLRVLDVRITSNKLCLQNTSWEFLPSQALQFQSCSLAKPCTSYLCWRWSLLTPPKKLMSLQQKPHLPLQGTNHSINTQLHLLRTCSCLKEAGVAGCAIGWYLPWCGMCGTWTGHSWKKKHAL